MAELLDRIKVTDEEEIRQKLPEEVREFEFLGKNERGRLAGQYEDGRRKTISEAAASILLETIVNFGAGEKQSTPAQIPETDVLNNRINELEQQLANERQSHSEELKRLETRHAAEMESLRQEFKEFREETAETLRLLNEAVEGLTTELAARNNISEPAREEIEATLEEAREEAPESEAETPPPAEEPEEAETRVSRRVAVVPGDPETPTEERVVERDIVSDAPPLSPTGGRVVETEERWYSPSRARAALFAGGLVVGAALWELVIEPVFGIGDGGVTKKEVINIINHHHFATQHQVAADHAAEMKAIDTSHDKEMQAIHGVYKHVSEDHRREMGALHGIHKEVAKLRRQELKERITGSGLYFGFRYPWDWAANKVGIYRATPYLHELAAKAARHGHKVQWIYKNHLQILKIDNTTNSRHVIGVLNGER